MFTALMAANLEVEYSFTVECCDIDMPCD